MSVLEASLAGLVTVLSWPTFGFLMIGVVVGLIFGAIPGIGGITAFIILFPLLLNLGAEAGFALIIGLSPLPLPVTRFPPFSWAFQVPLAPRRQSSTAMPWQKRGSCSRSGGGLCSFRYRWCLWGPYPGARPANLRPLVLLLQSPEFFALGLWGITMVSVLSGKTPLKGITMGILGMMLATVE